MQKRLIQIGIPAAVGIVAALTLAVWVYPIAGEVWQSRYPSWIRGCYAAGQMKTPIRVAGLDKTPPPKPRNVDIEGTLETFGKLEGDGSFSRWPGFRGEGFDNVSTEDIKLIRSFPETGPPVVWSVDLGKGHAGPAVCNGRVYVFDYDSTTLSNALRCFSFEDGRELWRRHYKMAIKSQHGVSRTVPAVDDDYVVAMGPKCTVICCRAEDGAFVWGLDLVKEYGTKIPEWYAGQCLRLDNDKVIIAPGGSKMMIAVELATGKVLWSTPNPRGWKMTHCSILPVSFAGKTIYVYPASGGVVGVDSETGKELFATDAWRVKIANIPTPVDLGGGTIFLSGGYGAGSLFLHLQEQGDTIGVKVGRRLTPGEFGTEQQTPIFYKGNLYGVLSKAGADKMQLTCLDATGERVWVSGTEDRFGLGPYMIADGMILLVDDDGTLTLAEASAMGYRRLARARVIKGETAWGPLAIVDGFLLVRNLTKMVCLDLRAQGADEEEQE